MVMLCYEWVCYSYKYESTEDQKTEFSYRSPIVNLACPLGIASANWEIHIQLQLPSKIKQVTVKGRLKQPMLTFQD